jgi:bla regulator protein BlaR1
MTTNSARTNLKKLVILLAITTPLHPQILHPTDPLPTFEVATIKPWHRTPPPPLPDGAPATPKIAKIDPGHTSPQLRPQLHMILPIEILITDAFNLPLGSGKRIIGGPEWLRQDIDQYEIQAKIDDTQFAAMQKMPLAQQRQQISLMEQSLLADRFKLKVHFETRELPVYTLVIAKGGPKLTPAKEGEPTKLSALNNGSNGELTATAVTLDQFAHSPFLGPATHGQPVIDQTSLKGAYDFTLSYSPEQSADTTTAETDPPMFTAIQQQLGLKLVPSKGPVDVIVIDHIEQPSAN